MKVAWLTWYFVGFVSVLSAGLLPFGRAIQSQKRLAFTNFLGTTDISDDKKKITTSQDEIKKLSLLVEASKQIWTE